MMNESESTNGKIEGSKFGREERQSNQRKAIVG